MTAGILVALIILEVLLNFYNPFGFRIKSNKIILPVNTTYKITNRDISVFDGTVVHKKNSIGFRGEDPPGTKEFDKYLTIITVGGSTTECFPISEGKTWTDILGKHLSASFKRVWINNAGLDGHSTVGHYILMRDYIVKLRPKLVLFMVGINDVGNRGSVEEFASSSIKSKLYLENPAKIIKRLSAYSEVINLMVNMYRYSRAKSMGLTYLKYVKSPSQMNKLIVPDSVWNSIINQNRQFLEGFKSRLRKIIMLAKDNSIEPVFITQAALLGDAYDENTGVYLGDLKEEHLNLNGKTWWNLLELYNDITRQVCNEEGILLIDFAKKMRKNSLYFSDNIHFTNEGAKIAGDIIYLDLCPFLAKKYPEYIN